MADETTNETRHGKIAEGTERRKVQGTLEEIAEWDAAADAADMSFAAWARKMLNLAASAR